MGGRHQTIDFTRSKRRRKAERANEKANKSLKAKFLSKSLSRESLRTCELFFKNKRHMHVHVCVSVNIFTTGGSTVPLSLHANYTLNPTILHTLCNSFKQNQSSALPGYPSLFSTILKARTPDNTIDASSARVSKLDTTPHKMTSLYHYSLRTSFEY